MRISDVELVVVFPIDLRIKVIEEIKPSAFSFAPSDVIIIIIIIIIIIVISIIIIIIINYIVALMVNFLSSRYQGYLFINREYHSRLCNLGHHFPQFCF